MQSKLKAIWSVCVIGLFLLMAYASTWDEVLTNVSTNVSVAIKDCETKPQSLGHLGISIHAIRPLGESFSGEGDLYITHQKVNPDSCTYEIIHDISVGFQLDDDGYFTYTGFEYEHNNSQDLIRVEVNINGIPGNSVEWKKVVVQYYNQGFFAIDAKILYAL